MSARTLHFCTMSLDGFISGPDGDKQWLRPQVSEVPGVVNLWYDVRPR
jgi:hypothetical protein